MSSVDERIVEMRFENDQFEKGVDSSLKSLNKLKAGLNLDGAADGLQNLQTTAKGFDLSNISEGVDKITNRFSLLGIMADQAIRMATNGLISLGHGMIDTLEGLSVDQISAGFGKYERKINSVQTIMNATGKSIDEVNASLDKLNWYTDETSYSYTDMVDNIAKFTSAGRPLEEAVTSMIGIANAAGYAGANVQDASHAMEGFSKAMAQGYMSRQNWQWIRTAHMDTMKFKQQIIEAALAEGTLAKVQKKVDGELQDFYYVADKAGRPLKNLAVSAEDFETNLAKGWLTNEVMTKTLNKYGAFTENIYAEYLRTGELTSEIIEKFGEGTDSLGLAAFKASQEAKTFSDAINSVKDAVSTGWMVSFEQIFGNYEEAKKLWTTVANELWEVFASGGERRNEILREWHNTGGYQMLLDSIRNIWEGTKAIGEAVKGVFEQFFPPLTTERLMDFTTKFKKFSSVFKDAFAKTDIENLPNYIEDALLGDVLKQNGKAQKNIKNITDAFSGLFSIVKLGKSIFTSFTKILSPLTRLFGEMGKSIFDLSGKVGKYITTLVDSIVNSETYGKIVDKLTGYVENFTTFLLKGTKFTKDFIKTFSKTEAFQNFMEKIKSGAQSIKKLFLPYISKAKNKINDFFTTLANIDKIDMEEIVGNIITWFTNFSNKVIEIYGKIKSFLSPALGILTSAYGRLLPYAESAWIAVKKFWDNMIIGKQFGPYISQLFTNWKGKFDKLCKSAKDFIENFNFKDLWKTVQDFFAPAIDKIDSWIDDVKKKLENIDLGKVAAVGLVTATIPTIISIGVAFGEAAKLLKASKGLVTNLNDILNKWKSGFKSKLMEIAKAITVFATAIGILAVSFKLISTVDSDKVKDALNVMKWLGGGLAGLTTVLGILSRFNLLGDIKGVGLAMLEISAAIVMLSGSFILIDKMKSDSIINNLYNVIIIGGLMAMAIATLSILGKYAPTMSKGSLTMVAFAASILILAEALNRLSNNLKSENMESALTAIVTLTAIMSAFSIMAANFKFGSGIGMVGAVASIFLLIKLFEKLSDKSIETVSKKAHDNISFIISTLGIILFLAGIGRAGGKYAAKTGMSVLAMSASILIIYESIKKLGEMDTEVLAKGGIVVGLIMAILASMAKSTMYAGQNSGKAGLAVLAMASSLLTIYLAIKKIGQLDAEIMVKGLSGVIVSLTMLGLALRSLRNLKGVKGAGGALLGMAVVIGTIAAALSYLTLFSWEDLSKGVLGIGVTLVALSSSLKIASGAKFDKSSIIGFGIGIVALVGVAAAIKTLANENWQNLGAAALGISVALLAVSASMRIISNAKFDWKTGLGQALAMCAGIGAFWVIGKILSKLSETDWDGFTPTMESIIKVFDHVMAAAEIMAITSGVLGKFVTPGAFFTGLGEMTVALVAIAVVFLGISYLVGLADGGKIVEGAKTIGDAIGGFLGGIVGEGMESAASHLESIGEYLSNFIDKSSGFFDGISKLPPNIGGQMLQLTTSIMNFSKLGKKINSGKDIGLDTIGEQLSALSDGLSTFSESTAKIDLDNIGKAVEAGSQLNGLLNSLLPTGGLIQTVFGESQWSSLYSGLSTFGEAMKQLSVKMPSVEIKNIEKAVEAGNKLNGLLSELEPSGGTIQKLFGDKSWNNLSEGLSYFGQAMSFLSQHAANIDLDNIGTAVDAGTQLNNLLTNVLPEPGAWDSFWGDKGPKWSTISDGLSNFGLAISSFSNVIAMGTFDDSFTERLKNISGITDLFSSLNSSLGNDTNVDSVNGSITSIGITLSKFSDQIVDLKADNLNNAREFIAGIRVIAEEFASVGTDLGNALTTALETSISSDIITGVGEAFLSSFNGAFTDLSSITSAGEAIGNELVGSVNNMVTNMEPVAQSFVSTFVGKISSEAIINAKPAGMALAYQTISGASSRKNDMVAAGEQVGHGFAVGILNKAVEAYNAGTVLGNAATTGAKTAVDVNSPSRVFIGIGESCGEGLVIGFNNSTSYARTAAVKLAEESLTASAQVLKGFDNLGDFNIDAQPVITPVLDLSQVDVQAQRLNSMLNKNTAVSLSGRIDDNQRTRNIDELIMVGSAILEEIRGGHDLYFDDGAFAGRINRRLGVKI